VNEDAYHPVVTCTYPARGYHRNIVRFQSILISEDDAAVKLLTRVMRDLGIEVEHYPKSTDAAVRLAKRPVDAIIVDTDAGDHAISLLESSKELATCKRTLGIVLSRPKTGKPVAGAHIVLYKPISVERVVHGLRAIRNLMARERRAGSHRVPVTVKAMVKGERIGTVDVVLVDLSLGGAALRSAKSLSASGVLTLQCQLPSTSATITATAEIVWSDTKNQFGVRFLEVPIASRTILATWLHGMAHVGRTAARGRAAGS
jgi:CheY-like chemotaxis protein